jgi:hypothetical protein
MDLHDYADFAMKLQLTAGNRVHILKVKKYLPGAYVSLPRAFKFSYGQNQTHKII